MGCDSSKKNHRNKMKIKDPSKKANKKVIEVKVLILGDTSVGKTSMISRFIENRFSTVHEVTIGTAFFQHQSLASNGMRVKMNIWDTGGSERYHSVTNMYYKNAKAAIFVHDVTRPKTFEVLKYWMEDLNANEDPKRMVLGLAANKFDQYEENKFNLEPCKMYAKENMMIYMETSAKSGLGINELFKKILDSIDRKSVV